MINNVFIYTQEFNLFPKYEKTIFITTKKKYNIKSNIFFKLTFKWSIVS